LDASDGVSTKFLARVGVRSELRIEGVYERKARRRLRLHCTNCEVKGSSLVPVTVVATNRAPAKPWTVPKHKLKVEESKEGAILNTGRESKVTIRGATLACLFAVGVSAVQAPPSVSPGGVLNAASYAVGAPLAPGSIVAVLGSFPLSATADAQATPLPTSLLGLSIRLDTGASAPLFFASSGQVDFQVPWEMSEQTSFSLTAVAAGQTSAPQTVDLAPFAPGIFTVNAQGTDQGAIIDNFSYQLIDPSNPATAGSTFVQIYCTGLGAVTNQPPSGSPVPSGPPYATTTTTPTVTIGGVAAPVLFAGLAPGFVGLYHLSYAPRQACDCRTGRG
jgi:uncharacterized protein (TIGR03437 family)